MTFALLPDVDSQLTVSSTRHKELELEERAIGELGLNDVLREAP